MSDAQIALFSSSSIMLVENLSDIADEEENEEEDAETSATGEDVGDLPDGAGQTILCLGGRGAIDDAVSAMLSQIIDIQGAEVSSSSYAAMTGQTSQKLGLDGVDTVVVSFLNGNSKSHARQIIRRLKRAKPSMRVGILMPTANGQNFAQIDASDISADFIATTLNEAAKLALTKTAPTELVVLARKISRPRLRAVKPIEAA